VDFRDLIERKFRKGILNLEYFLDFLKNFNFIKILLLGLGEMGEGTLEISACLPLSLSGLDEVFLLEDVLLN